VIADSLTFSTLTKALKATGLDATLGNKDEFTIFAPTDEAFGKLPAETLTKLMLPENKEKLRMLLLYHVVAGKVLAADLTDGEVKTVNGREIENRCFPDKIEVDGSRFTVPMSPPPMASCTASARFWFQNRLMDSPVSRTDASPPFPPIKKPLTSAVRRRRLFTNRAISWRESPPASWWARRVRSPLGERAADHFAHVPSCRSGQAGFSFWSPNLPLTWKPCPLSLMVMRMNHPGLDADFDMAGLGMAGHIGERFLGDPVEHRARRAISIGRFSAETPSG
jgi:hypothetical protein